MKRLIILCCALCCGCGWTPMYSDSQKLRREARDIYIAPIAGTNGIDLRNYLILNWNTPNEQDAIYKLSVGLNDPATIYKGLQRSGDATWEEIRMTASWTLTSNGKTIAQSSESASESYTFVSDLISANAAKLTATSNAIRQIGERIETKVNAKLKKIEN